MLTDGYEPHQCDLGHGFGAGLVLAGLYGPLDGYVAIQGDGTEVHDRGGGEEHVQKQPNGAQKLWKGPGRVCREGEK